MATLPEKIAVKYSEDLARFTDIRPVVRQPMTLPELVGLVLASTGKHPGRVRALLRGGTCVYNIYRYWWEGFDLDDSTLDELLAQFPDPNPTRKFQAPDCQWARFADAGEPRPHTVTLEKKATARRRWFRRQSFWDYLMDLASVKPLAYHEYSYYHRADLFRAELTGLDCAVLRHQSRRLAPRAVQEQLGRGSDWVWLELACPR